MHTDNHIYGVAKNPFDPERSCGGSSGGDAGMVGSKCVPFAIGSDIGGSIRGPAGFNNTVAFKPTAHRMSLDGNIIGTKSLDCPQTIIRSTPGPYGNSVDDVVLGMKSFFVKKHFDLDYTVTPIEFRN